MKRLITVGLTTAIIAAGGTNAAHSAPVAEHAHSHAMAPALGITAQASQAYGFNILCTLFGHSWRVYTLHGVVHWVCKRCGASR